MRWGGKVGWKGGLVENGFDGCEMERDDGPLRITVIGEGGMEGDGCCTLRSGWGV
jgi:hypothetical protein